MNWEPPPPTGPMEAMTRRPFLSLVLIERMAGIFDRISARYGV